MTSDSVHIDGQTFTRRCIRGRRTKYVARVLSGFALNGLDKVGAYAIIAQWDLDVHILFWDLLGYDGSWWDQSSAGAIGESKRLWMEVTR
jgi:hypothetical protein